MGWGQGWPGPAQVGAGAAPGSALTPALCSLVTHTEWETWENTGGRNTNQGVTLLKEKL